ncbi:MAG: serine/threonine-protein phosphatase [Deltaproteobacteria bacterium]|nr:serine/threonine-protein phosphatase [Deltaproteobacteria bacterium]
MKAIEVLQYFGFTDIGLKRKKNEDAYVIKDVTVGNASENKKLRLFAVADGMGGHSCGDQASAMACRELKRFLSKSFSGLDAQSYVKQLDDRIHDIDRFIRNAGLKDPECEHMGTTLSAMLMVEDFGVTAHVGDSRIYRLRNARLTQLTSDHTFVQEMIDEGELPAEAAATHPLRNVLTRAVGTQVPLEQVETRVLDLTFGDRFLISSDGLHKMVSADEIAGTLIHMESPKQAAEQLLQLALANGGDDNITGIIIHI